MRLFISGTGTDVGKTWLTRGLARAAHRKQLRVLAVKPLETGEGTDAVVIARAAGHEPIPGFYRATAPIAPFAATLEGEPPPDLGVLVRIVTALDADLVLIEGAGGLLSPIDALRDMADLAAALSAPIVLVARDALGAISAMRTAFESADARGLQVAACVLTRGPVLDASARTNAEILGARLPCPVFCFAPRAEDDDALADAADALLSRTLPGP